MDPSRHVTSDGVTSELQPAGWTGAVTSTGPPVPPCGYARHHRVSKQEKHGRFVDKLQCGKTRVHGGDLPSTETSVQSRPEGPGPWGQLLSSLAAVWTSVPEPAANIWPGRNI